MERLQSLDKDVAIEINHLTKDYGHGRGIFDISFKIPKGSVFGYCGTNGSGKTTTLRHIMGFLKPDSGEVKVNGLDPWKNGDIIKKSIGYLPGEIAFPPVDTGSDFLKSQADLINLKDMSKAEKIINAMQLDPTANLRRMSKGMKQKTAIVATFMHSPDIIILDEPTTGLDPLMRESFIEILEEEKARGATILMSNHMFDELDETCDYVAFIKDGRIIDIVDLEEIHNRPYRDFIVGFYKKEDCEKAFANGSHKVHNRNLNTLKIVVRVERANAKEFLEEIKNYEIKQCSEVKYTLERYFFDNFGGKDNGSRNKR
ncbi:MAG: ATP-binding cassette domain-containing protein [Bacilli bacterium]|nr:ATP-binding cassette domain-containing protein [Bacilli bacterium]